ncbi:hypothetical protein KIPB_000005 [Kipferlia bialata]|uniref:Uncharacterized protein n=1 Tax=Kipferlia bialata TaxID=797122 RepID=A0A391NTX4_9EUKA|nr:hypothetical protein KIPB_000005 [Kipferlia bialata]|eukprot:g5.t1
MGDVIKNLLPVPYRACYPNELSYRHAFNAWITQVYRPHRALMDAIQERVFNLDVSEAEIEAEGNRLKAAGIGLDWKTPRPTPSPSAPAPAVSVVRTPRRSSTPRRSRPAPIETSCAAEVDSPATPQTVTRGRHALPVTPSARSTRVSGRSPMGRFLSRTTSVFGGVTSRVVSALSPRSKGASRHRAMDLSGGAVTPTRRPRARGLKVM